MGRLFAALLALTLLFTTPTFTKDQSELAAKLRLSTRQMVMSAEQEVKGYCTAFSINDTKDYFATASHCVTGMDYIVVGEKDHFNQAFTIYNNLDADMAVVVVPDSGDVPALKLAHEVHQGMEVFSYGYGYAFPSPMFRAGYVAITDVAPFNKPVAELNVGADEHFIATDFSIIPGMSGGPIVNADGELVTINQLGDEYMALCRTTTEVYKYLGKYWEK